jgi:uncharacterized oligopeptide transporter (OPT) family protein
MEVKMNNKTERRFWGIDQLSLRGLLLGILGSLIITASSIYVALRISALPWPTIFVAVLSMALLKAMGRTTLNEINITQTAMSAGAMVGGGLAFTLPGLWITGVWAGPGLFAKHFLPVLAIAFAGMTLGTVSTWFLRQRFVDREALPYPIGKAAAETLIAGDAGGRKFAILFGAMGFSAIFTLMRDLWKRIPAALTAKQLYAANFQIGIWLSPMAAGIGYMIGPLYTGVWFLGAVISYLLIIPLGPVYHFFGSVNEATAFKNTAGIGLMVGTGIGILFSYLIASLKKYHTGKLDGRQPGLPDSTPKSSRTQRYLVYAAIGGAFVVSVAAGLQPLPAVLLILGVTAASAMAAVITGETGINPMEVFGIIILLAIRLMIRIDPAGAFFITAGVAVACGYSGDLLNDYKAGRILGTNPAAQLIAQIAGGVVGVIVAAVAMFAIIAQFGGVGPENGLPAAQAFAVSQMVNGVGNPLVLGGAIAIGAVLSLLKIPAMTLGIGMYLPFEITAAMFIGGLVRLVTGRFRPALADFGNIAASGLLGGEGIAGVSIAIYLLIHG